MKREIELDECPECGRGLFEIETDAPEGEVQDGDSIVCECGMKGSISCDSETDPYISWFDPLF